MEGLAHVVVVVALSAAVVGAMLGAVAAIATGAPLVACAAVGAVLGPPAAILILKRLGKH